jgi:hypothetical protein
VVNVGSKMERVVWKAQVENVENQDYIIAAKKYTTSS